MRYLILALLLTGCIQDSAKESAQNYNDCARLRDLAQTYSDSQLVKRMLPAHGTSGSYNWCQDYFAGEIGYVSVRVTRFKKP